MTTSNGTLAGIGSFASVMSDTRPKVKEAEAAAPPSHSMQNIVLRTGLQLPQKLSFSRWLSIGKKLSDVSTSAAWCLGDWLIHGELAYTGRYRDAIKQTSLDYQTLRNYAWVARCFELSRRRETLSFGHHAEVAALPEPEQEYWLRKAEDLGWSRNRLRREVRGSLNERSSEHHQEIGHSCPLDDDEECGSDICRLEVNITQEQLVACEAAATSAGLALPEWAATVLCEAASSGPVETRFN